MSLKIYNTLTRKKEAFEPIEPGKVRMYVCGPTVYDSAHVGHAMSTIVFDVIRRYLEFKGYEVSHVMNYTDVDDKVIRRAIELGVDAVQLAARYIAEYDRHLEELNTLIPMITPRVSKEIAGIINMVEGLVDGGYAYEVDGDVYFRVARDPDYGKLSGRKLEDMRAGFRLEVDERKEDAADFALWKASKPGEPSWESPWGPGRPGWHIECSAMAYRHLGEEIDIHGGGNDLIFPHHENEIAQSESLTEKPFARYWMHNGMLQIGGEDMSKSLGNMVTVDEFLADHSSDALRLMVLNASYRAPLIFTEEVIEQAERGLDRLMGALRPGVAGGDVDPEVTNALERKVVEVRNGFVDSMDDDFNSAGALAQLFDLVRSINQSRDAGVADATLQSAQATLKELAGVLGLRLERDDTVSSDATPFIDLLVSVRDELREAKEWALADMIRNKLEELGVLLEDEKSGTSWRHR
ncbi:MAG: cysteine--tRNA ligase [Anaerolineales bacterium]|nr:cysteine--tRNA ligase [Anaerolineales bacterium]